MDLETVLKNKILGDIAQTAKTLGISRHNASMALKRPGSKYHDAVINTLFNIITIREVLLNTTDERHKTSNL